METISDPVDLPTEIFRQFLTPLSRQQVAHASSTSKKWKRYVEGDRLLFTEVNAIRFPGQDQVSNGEMSEKVVDHLKRFSLLSRWNLQKARLDLGLLANGEKMIAKTWDWGTLPGVALQTLTLSRKSLKVLSFDLSRVSLKDEEVLPTIADQVIAMIKFTEENFKNCTDLTIRASTYLTLVSKSDSKILSVIHSQEEDDDDDEPLIAEERDAELFPNDFQMIYQMGVFTGGKIVKVIGERVRTYNLRSLQMLTQSLHSLSEIRFDTDSIIHLEGWLEWFTFLTPKLERLQIMDSIKGHDTFFIQVLESSNLDDPNDIVVSNLKELNLLCRKVGSIRWDDHFTKWIGNQLETLDIGWRSGLEEEVPVNLGSFIDFLKNNASTLWHIRIEGIALASLPEGLDLEGLTLPKLTSLKLDTNPETIEFFTKVKMPILSRLILSVSDKAEKKELPHEDIRKLMASSSQSLTELRLKEMQLKEEEGTKTDFMVFKPVPKVLDNSVFFPKMRSLNLDLNAANNSGYCLLNYPSLKSGIVTTRSKKI